MVTKQLIEYALLAAAILVQFTLIGVPLRILFNRMASRELGIPSAIYGLSAVIVTGWYWYKPLGGIKPLSIALLAFGAICWIVEVATKRLYEPPRLRASIQKRLPEALLFVAIVVIFAANFAAPNRFGHFSVSSAGNNDASSYTFLGQHLRDLELSDDGNVAGFNTGARIQSSFDFGSLATVASASAVIDQPVYKFTTALLICVVFLCALSTYLLLGLITRAKSWMIALATAIAFSTVLFSYIWSQYFLNQILAMATVTALTTLLVSGTKETKTKQLLPLFIPFGLIFAATAAFYPHMALLGTIVIAAPLLGVFNIKAVMRRCLNAAVMGIGGIAAAFILLPTPMWRIPSNLRDVGDVVAGWPLPAFSPADVFGFTSAVQNHHTLFSWVLSFVVIAVVIAIGLRIEETRKKAFYTLLLTISVWFTYFVIFNQQDSEYRQWKWLTFFVPLYVAASLLVLMSIIRRFIGHSESSVALISAIFSGYLLITLTNSTVLTFPQTRASAYNYVSADMIAAGNAIKGQGLAYLNLNVDPYWESMWLAYFAEPAEVNIANVSYYTTAPQTADWTLQSVELAEPRGSTVVWANASYELVKLNR